MTKELESLEKKFILNEDMEHENLQLLIGKILQYCKLDTNGFVLVSANNLGMKDKVHLVLAARYLAAKLQEKLGKPQSIPQEAKIEEISKMLGETDKTVRARLCDLAKEKKVLATKRGSYRVASYSIDELLGSIDKKGK